MAILVKLLGSDGCWVEGREPVPAAPGTAEVPRAASAMRGRVNSPPRGWVDGAREMGPF